MIGTELGLLDRSHPSALIAARLLSIVPFPMLALTLLRRVTEQGVGKTEHPITNTRQEAKQTR